MKAPLTSLIALLGMLSAAGTTTLPTPRKQFVPDQTWHDNNGIAINAHGGGVMFHEGTYFWFDQHMISGKEGNNTHVGVHCYSSTDLYNWKDERALYRRESPQQARVHGVSISSG